MSYREGWGPHGEIFISAIPALRFHPIDSPEGQKALKEYEASEEAEQYVQKYITGGSKT